MHSEESIPFGLRLAGEILGNLASLLRVAPGKLTGVSEFIRPRVGTRKTGLLRGKRDEKSPIASE